MAAPAERQWKKVLAEHDPVLWAEWRAFVAASMPGGLTSSKVKHLIWVAIDCVTTHLYSVGAVLHVEHAVAEGATLGEVMDVLRIASRSVPRGLEAGFPILVEELERAGLPLPAGTKVGDSWREIAARVSPDFLRAYERLLDSPGRIAGLDDRTRCLVTLAVESCPALVNPDGIRLAVRRALELGIPQGEIIEAMQLASLIGTHAITHALAEMAPALGEASRRA